ncbi:double zinc ribbon domain-containing protein [Spirochaeta dissipatitropha]
MQEWKKKISPAFFCENCRNKVSAGSIICPHCGKMFSSVRCPECGHTGKEHDFISGCPKCGHLRQPIPQQSRKRPPAAAKTTVSFPGFIVVLITLVIAFAGLVLIYLNI